MSTAELVSIVIPLYNAEPYLEDTVASMLEQTMTDIHVYIIDDQSTDGSSPFARHLAESDSRISYHLTVQKGGCPAPTKNVGIQVSKGKYVAFCDHDDWWHKEKLSRQVAFLEANPQVNLLGCNVEIIDTDRNISLGNFWKDPCQVNPATIRQLVLEGPIFASTTCMIGRRSFLTEHQFDTRFIGSDEYDLSLHATLDDPEQVALLPETLAYWRWHQNSLSHSEKAANRALRDETLFAEKVLARSDLTPEDQGRVLSRLRTVTRRAGNAELAATHTVAARSHYRRAVKQGDTVSLMLLLGSYLSPYLSSRLTSWKRNHSHKKPLFR